jgi:hypothetical protein
MGRAYQQKIKPEKIADIISLIWKKGKGGK